MRRPTKPPRAFLLLLKLSLTHLICPPLTRSFGATNMLCMAFVKTFGNAIRLQLLYKDNSSSNRCYIIFATATAARLALQAVVSEWSPCWGPLLTDCRWIRQDYNPNTLERTSEEATLNACQAPTPGRFVAYYRNGVAYAYTHLPIPSNGSQ